MLLAESTRLLSLLWLTALCCYLEQNLFLFKNICAVNCVSIIRIELNVRTDMVLRQVRTYGLRYFYITMIPCKTMGGQGLMAFHF